MKTDEFFTKLKDNPRPVIVDLWASWCAPCRVMEPSLKQVAQKYENQVDVWKVNVDQSPEVVRALKVMGIPTTIGFAQGEEIIRKTGVQSAEALDILFDATLNRRSVVILPPAPVDRWIRSMIGLMMIVIGWATLHSLVVVAIGAVVLFSAFYDRCPIFRAVAPRLIGLIKRLPKQTPKEKPLI